MPKTTLSEDLNCKWESRFVLHNEEIERLDLKAVTDCSNRLTPDYYELSTLHVISDVSFSSDDSTRMFTKR